MAKKRKAKLRKKKSADNGPVYEPVPGFTNEGKMDDHVTEAMIKDEQCLLKKEHSNGFVLVKQEEDVSLTELEDHNQTVASLEHVVKKEEEQTKHWDPVHAPAFRRERSLSHSSDGLTSISSSLKGSTPTTIPQISSRSSQNGFGTVSLGTQSSEFAVETEVAGPEPPLPEDDFIRYYVKGENGDDDDDDSASFSFFDFVRQDFGADAGSDQGISGKNASVEDDVFNFVRVPIEMEKTLGFGFFLCVDSLLFVMVYLPLRIARAIFLGICTILLPAKLGLRFHRAQLYDLLRGFIVLVAFQVVLWAPMSRIYHYVRGQTFIKLYAIFNMLDIFDRLFCSFGQDILDSLFYMSKTSPKAYGRIGFRLVLGSIYAALHSLLYFVRIVTLNVAINSTSNALIAILISNNFVELKGNVFKRFADANLFQITCSDIVERFELFVFLALTAIQHTDSVWDFLCGSALYISMCELLVDWIKHAFITKFNRIPYSSYMDETEVLCRDIAPVSSIKNPYADSQRQGGRPVDPTQAVAQRIGLATLPLTCVILRFAWANSPLQFQADPFSPSNLTFIGLVFLCLLAFKSFLGIMIRGYACKFLMARERSILQRDLGRLASLPTNHTEKEFQKATVAKHMQKINGLSGIRRYMIFKSRVPS